MKIGPLGTLLITLVLMMLLAPLAALVPMDVPASRILTTLVLLAGVYALHGRAWVFRAGLVLALLAISVAWLTSKVSSPALILADYALSGTFYVLLTFQILDAILATDHVSMDTVMGGICIYLLFGTLWVTFYSALEYVIPGSYQLEGVPVSQLRDLVGEAYRFPELTYYSFVTLTTLGYGDIVPTHPLARALATGEAIVGQVYLAVFVASLVGLHLAERRRAEPPLP